MKNINKIIILVLFVAQAQAQNSKDTNTIRLFIDSLTNLKQNALSIKVKREKTIIANIPYLKKFPTNNLLFTTYYLLADIYVRKGQNELAKPYIDTCYLIAKKINNKKQIARTAYIEGIYFKFNGKSDIAIKKWFESVETFKTIKDEEGELASLSAIAREYDDLNQHDKAEKYLIDVIDRRIKLKDDIGLSNSYNTLANVFVSTKRYDEAIIYFNKALVLALKLSDTITLGYTYNNLARVFNKQEKLKEAEQNWIKSYDLFMRTNDAFGTAMIINNIAYIQIKLKKYKKGIEYATNAVNYSTEHDIQVELQRAHSNLLDAYYGLNDFKNGFKEHEIIIDMKDAEFNKDVASSVADAEQKYKSKIQQDSITILNTDKKVNVLLLNEEKSKTVYYKIFFLVTLLSLIVIFVTTYFIIKNKQTKHKLKQQALLNQVVFDTEQQERERIARDLHDSVGQKLSVVKMQLSMKNADALASSVLLDEAIQDVRNVSHNLMPADLSKGLILALENMCEQINYSSTTVKLHLNKTEAVNRLQLDKQHTILIYRMVQELVNNAIKYAQAQNIHINMDCEKNQLQLNLTDDGVGFDITTLEHKKGIGIKNIKERVQQLIGNMQLTSNIGKGTQFNISIPV